MTNRIKFLISLGNLIKTGGVKTVKQAMDFAEQQYGKLDNSFIDDILNQKEISLDKTFRLV